MKFDLLEAIALVKEHFGTSGEITVSTVPYGVAVTLSVIKYGGVLRTRFMLTDIELTCAIPQIMNIRFNHAIRELQLAIENTEREHPI